MQVDDGCDLVVSNCQVEMLHHQKDLTAGAKKKRGIDHSHTQSDIYRGKKMYTIGSLKQASDFPLKFRLIEQNLTCLFTTKNVLKIHKGGLSMSPSFPIFQYK